jgi:hypothetical protein
MPNKHEVERNQSQAQQLGFRQELLEHGTANSAIPQKGYLTLDD